MDYEKTLKEALNSKATPFEVSSWIEEQFPELKESEDERIRKELIKETKGSEVRLFEIVTNDEFIAWLEKQGESSDKIHYWTEEEIEPIISDYLRGAEHYGGMIGRLRCLKPKSLEKQGEKGVVLRDAFGYEEGREKGREEGVMLVLDNPRKYGLEKQGEKDEEILILKDQIESLHAAIIALKEVHKIELENQGKQIPANSAKTCKDEQNPAWSEEDEKMFNSALWHVKNSCGNGGKNSGEFKVYNWLKSIKDRYTWQPSDEQIKSLQESIGIVGELTPRGECLKELAEQLKKLMEE